MEKETKAETATLPYRKQTELLNDNQEEPNLFGEIAKLADLGMGAEKISKKMNIPKCEVDLLLKMKKIGDERKMYVAAKC